MDEQQPRAQLLHELTVSRAWNAGWFHADRLRTTEGQPVTVVYRGRWTFGFGPDFQGALIAFGAELRQGDVEVHLRASGWREHGHHLDPAYNSVILHVALEAEAQPQLCRRQDGVVIPTLILGPALRGPLAHLPLDPTLAAFQASHALTDRACVAEVSSANRARALAVIEQAGDARLTAKAATFEAAFTGGTPGQVLYAGLLDALGYAQNRAPMAALASALPLAALEARLPARDAARSARVAAALLLGVAGFIPVLPALGAILALPAEELAAIEAIWVELSPSWRDLLLPRDGWSLARVRPANHPARRLLGLASLLARTRRLGLLAACLEPSTADDPATGLAELRALLHGPARPTDPFGRYLGADRVTEMLVKTNTPQYATRAALD